MRIINAHQNNLRNITLSLPEGQLILVTGLSGSGKSSLAMEVIANEGYRYFLESFPSFNQQNHVVIPSAEVGTIEGLPPVIRVQQSRRFQSVNATLGTLSDLAPVFRLLFARYSGKEVMSRSLFSFNHPKGACTCCHGIGRSEFIDLHKLVDDEAKTLREGAIATTLPNGYIVYSQVTVEELNKVCMAHGFNVDTPWKDLTAAQRDVVLNGSQRVKVFYGKHSIESRLKWIGLKAKPREEGYYKGMLPIMNEILRRDRNPNILKFVSSRICPQCKGARIKAEHLNFRWKGLNFRQWMDLPLSVLYDRLQKADLNPGERKLTDQLCVQLYDMIHLGMGAYSLNTPSTGISSGDGQRIKLVKQVNSDLQGLLYLFDEPSIGLPEASRKYLRHIFDRLIKRGNTVMVVEHDLALIPTADWIVELGPGAGVNGGEVVFNGPVEEFLKAKGIHSPTLKALHMQRSENILKKEIRSIDELTLQSGELTVISRKTPAVMDRLFTCAEQAGWQVLTVTDQPIGKTPRSNPATYTGLADKIRDLLAKTEQAKAHNLGKSAFSFNNKTGRCEACEGAGVITLSMNILGTVNQTCPSCNGRRFRSEVLEVSWKGKNIAEIYDLSVTQALAFFKEEEQLVRILDLMAQLGLGYITLGQPSNTLSGGEAQRIKLTKHFAKRSVQTLLLLEEPGIGLHQLDVQALLKALHELKTQTAGIVCFENHDLFRASADIFINTNIQVKIPDLSASNPVQRDKIALRGVRTHHLKDLELDFPKHKLSVVTGISGSGKSSLVIDTLHGYGLQEMSRQFSFYERSRAGVNFQLDVDRIEGLSPTVCITRKERSWNERSVIADKTGIDRVLRFAFSRKAQYLAKEWSASHFSNRHELGRCPVCEGLGEELLPDFSRVVPDPEKSIAQGVFGHNKALAYYGHPGSQFMAIVIEVGKEYGFDGDTPFKELTETQREIILYGTGERKWTTSWTFRTKTREGTQEVNMLWKGLFNLLQEEYLKTRKNKDIESLKSLFMPVGCGHCGGSGLIPERLEITLGRFSIHQVRSMDFNHLDQWLNQKNFNEEIDQQLLDHIKPFLIKTIARARQLHIDHLRLNRRSNSLSGGEYQRMELITQLNSPLKGITYLLDEPGAGLSHDNIPELISLLNDLVAKGNTVIVIEHHKDLIMAADHLVELGPGAGKHGGFVTFQGSVDQYLNRVETHPYFKHATPVTLTPGKQNIVIQDLHRYSLNRKRLEVPVGGITALSGRSGIGKTTLVKEVLIPSMNMGKPTYCSHIEYPRSYSGVYYFEPQKLRSLWNTLLVSYLDLLKEVSKVFSKATGRKPGDFSYKSKTGQCPDCKGEGIIETALDAVSNAMEICEGCNGSRYRKEILQYEVENKNIAEVLALNLSEFRAWLTKAGVGEKFVAILAPLVEVGLGHLSLDQPVRTLSSGERQRLLLLNWFNDQQKNVLYIIDEPSVGLHFEDIDKLFSMLKVLGEDNDVLVIDHNPYLLGKIGVGMVLK